MPSNDERGPTSPPSPQADADSGETLLPTSIGSGLLAQQTTSSGEAAIVIEKVCPQCGNEYETGDRFCPRDGSPLRPKQGNDPLVGRVIADRYLMLARIGEGGMGRVYLAEHVKMNRQCAIKVMSPSLVNDTDSAERFAREALNAARILHQNVAAVFDFGEADKIVYLVMEYVNGESLSAILARDGPLEPRRAIDLARQIADGLSAAHELGIVHRDLKPDNVIVGKTRAGKETPKVVDFGIAKALSEGQQDALTRSGLVIGTPEYMSPEQLLGDPVDARSDLYSLGCIIYQMLTGTQPFASDSREQMIRRRLHEPPPHIRDVLPNIPVRIDSLIVQLLQRSPGDRLASAAQARDALDPALAIAGWDPVTMVSRPTPRSMPTVMGLPFSDPSLDPTQPLERQRIMVRRVGTGAVIGSVILLGAVLVWSRQNATSSAPLSRSDTSHVQLAPNTTPVAVPNAAPDTTATNAAIVPPAAAAPAPAPGATDSTRMHRPPQRSEPSTLSPKTPTTLSPAPSPDAALQRPLEGFATALASGKIEVVAAKFPQMQKAARDALAKFLGSVDHVHATTVYEPATIEGTRADLPFAVNVSFTTGGTGQPTGSKLSYRATLESHNGRWEITEIAPRS